MPNETTTTEGTLVSVTARAYNPFPNRQTGEMMPGGVTRKAYVVADFDTAPVEVKIDEATAVELQRAGYGAQVAMLVELSARGNEIQRRCLSLIRATTNA